MPNGATPLGYGAAVLPQSSFDPIKFGQQVAGLELGKKKEAAAIAKKQKEAALESANPELGKLKWTAPYINNYQKKVDDFRSRNIEWYKNQDGNLTIDQINDNKKFKEQTNAEFILLNQTYDNILKEKNRMLVDKSLDTTENKKEIERVSDPYVNDPEGMKASGGDILEYMARNPLNLQRKEEPLDLLGKLKQIKNLTGETKQLTESYIDPISGDTIYPSEKTKNIASGMFIARQEYANDPQLQKQFPNPDDFLRTVANTLQGKETTAQIRAGKDGERVRDVGGARVSGNVVVSQDQQDLELDITRTKQQIAGATGEFAPLSSEQQKVYRESIPSKGWAISKKGGGPVSLSSFVNNVGVITEDGIQNVGTGGQSMDIQLNSIRNIPTTNQLINISRLPASMNKDILLERSKDGNLPQNIALTKKEIRALRNLNLNNVMTDKPYGVGTIKNIQEFIDSKEESKFKKSISNAYLVPYEDIRGQLKNVGFELPETQPEQKKAKRVRSKKTGKILVLNEQTGKYENE